MTEIDVTSLLSDPRAEAGRAEFEPVEDFRDSEEFEKLEAEFRKMEIDGPTAVDWKSYNADVLNVLGSKSKDLVLATRLAFGLYQQEGYLGLAIGTTILRDLVDGAWDTMYPPLKRERGRAGAFDWLAEKIAALVEANGPDEASRNNVLVAHDALLDTDTLLEQKLTKSTVALGPLIRALRPHAKEARSALEEAEKAKAAAAATPEAPATPEPATAPPPAQSAEQPQTPTTPEPVAAPATPAPTPPKPIASSAPAAEVELGSGVDGALQAVFNAAGKAATMVRGEAPTDPRGYYAARFAQWGRLQILPPNTGGKTALPPPQKNRIAELQAIKAAGNHQGMITSAESAFVSSPFWLDAQFYLVSAMDALGTSYDSARALVTGELSSLLMRFPTLPDLTFSDGSPFASSDTRSWIAEALSSDGSVVSAGGSSGTSVLDQKLSEANALGQAGKLVDGLTILREYLGQCRGDRNWFKAQLGIADYCLRFELLQQLFPLLDHLRSVAETKGLDRWEPELAVEAEKIYWRGLANKNARQFVPDAAAAPLRASIMEKLSTLDMAAAAELTGRR